ncbi:unnamed protein product, partial [Brachionus calyciflorus]
QEYKNLFSPQDKQTLIEIFPNAFLTIVDYTHSVVNEIHNYYKELVDNPELIDKLNKSISDLDDEIERLEDDVNNWINKRHVKDKLNCIPDLNGLPSTHYWWTDENGLYSKNKFQ